MRSLRQRLEDLIAVDLRSLAALRVGLAICVLADLADRARDLTLLYTDAGAYPGATMLELKGPIGRLSLHYWAGADPGLQAALFALAAAAAVALGLGWHTRLASLACCYLVTSLQIRNPVVFLGGDLMLRMLLFWGLLLPLGARFSLDARRARAAPLPDRCVSPAALALLLQVAAMYWITGWLKHGDLWWNGQAVAYVLRGQEFVTPFGTWLLRWPRVLQGITWGTLAIELLGPFLAFSPLATRRLRIAAVALFWGFHLGLASCLNIGLFPLFSMAGWLAFLPGSFWPARSAAAGARPEPAGWRPRTRSLAALAALAFFALATAQQFGAPRVLPGFLGTAAETLGFRQGFGMFAPEPLRHSIAHRLLVRGARGRLRSAPAAQTLRAMLLVRNVTRVGERADQEPMLAGIREAFLRYQCRAWERRNPGRPPRSIALEQSWQGLDPGSALPERRIFAELRCDETAPRAGAR